VLKKKTLLFGAGSGSTSNMLGLWLAMCNALVPEHMAGECPTRNASWERLDQVPPDPVLFGRSVVMAELRQRAEKICRTNVPILLCGEGGTGKEALARWIHVNSEYASGEFVKVSCAAIPGTLLESELFGYEQGAFTGANVAKPGRVEMAHRGTLFLDEIADLDPNLQCKLLQFLQDGTFSRIGDHTERRIDARLICATHTDLNREMEAGRFRQDLFYRIHGFRLKVPTLRERREDIPALAEFFRVHFEKQFGTQTDTFPPEMIQYLQNLNWPGNLRELSNGVARYVLIGPEAAIHQEYAPKKRKAVRSTEGNGTPVTLKRLAKDAIRELERNAILEALRANQWNRRKTAQALKISYRALIYKIHDAGLMTRKATQRGEHATNLSTESMRNYATD
jgi:two-component system response regulator AtoC